jgi:hypothetical protein
MGTVCPPLQGYPRTTLGLHYDRPITEDRQMANAYFHPVDVPERASDI